MQEQVTGPRVMLRMSAVGGNATVVTATCGLQPRQIQRIHSGSSRHNETVLFQSYIQNVRRVSMGAIPHLVVHLDDPTSGAPVEVIHDGGACMIQWCRRQLTDGNFPDVTTPPPFQTVSPSTQAEVIPDQDDTPPLHPPPATTNMMQYDDEGLMTSTASPGLVSRSLSALDPSP
jgi:hypothetical protein